MNKLPNDWRELPFSECVNKISIKYKIKQKYYLKNGKYPIIDQGQNFISGYSNDKITINIKKPVIVFGDHTRCFKYIDFDFIAGADGIQILEPKEFFNEKLFYYFCLILDFPNKGYSRHYQYLAKTIIKIPPLAIQKQIAEKLDYSFDKIDKTLTFLKENKEYIKKYRLSILKYAFEGKLTPSSKNWKMKTLGEVCEINPKNKLDDNLEVSFIPMNLISDKFQNKFSYKIKNWKDVKKGYTHLQNNCIALAKITPCFENGKCVILRNLKNGYGAGTTELIILLPNSKKIIIEYIFYFMNTQHFIEQGKRNFKGSVGQLRIGTDFVSNYKIPIPNIETQKEIVLILDKKFKAMDEIERLNNENIENLLLLKKSLLKEAFSGKL